MLTVFEGIRRKSSGPRCRRQGLLAEADQAQETARGHSEGARPGLANVAPSPQGVQSFQARRPAGDDSAALAKRAFGDQRAGQGLLQADCRSTQSEHSHGAEVHPPHL